MPRTKATAGYRGPLIDVGWRGMEPIANPEMEPCPTCGLGVTREPTVTVLRDGRTYHQTILRCPNSRKKRAPTGARFNKWTVCPVRKIETEIGTDWAANGTADKSVTVKIEKASETEMANCHPSQKAKPAPKAWCDNIRQRLLAAETTQRDLANAAGLALSVVSKALTGRYDTTTLTMGKMNNALDVIENGRAVSKDPHSGETAGEGFIRENSEPLPTSMAPEILKDGSMFLPVGTEVKYCPGVGLSQPVDDTPHLSSRVSDLAEDQVRFWIELAEATKRLTAIESRLGHAIDGSEGVVSGFTQRLTKIESRLDADNSSHVDKGELSAVLTEMQTHTGNISNRQETQEYSLNQLAKSVERIDRDEAANSEKIDNLREDLTAWAGIFDMLSGTIENHKNSIKLLDIASMDDAKRLTDLENSVDNLRDCINGLANNGDNYRRRLDALEGHPSGGESPLWDALDVLTTDVKELRSSYVNRPWAARIEETVEALAAEIRMLHNYKRQDNSLMLAHADIVRRLNALELNNTDAFALRVIELLAGRLGS